MKQESKIVASSKKYQHNLKEGCKYMDSTETNAATTADTAPRVVTLRNKIGYAIGDMGNNFLFDMGQLYLLNYFTDVVGLPSAAAGTVFLVAKIWDAFADMSVGT